MLGWGSITAHWTITSDLEIVIGSRTNGERYKLVMKDRTSTVVVVSKRVTYILPRARQTNICFEVYKRIYVAACAKLGFDLYSLRKHERLAGLFLLQHLSVRHWLHATSNFLSGVVPERHRNLSRRQKKNIDIAPGATLRFDWCSLNKHEYPRNAYQVYTRAPTVIGLKTTTKNLNFAVVSEGHRYICHPVEWKIVYGGQCCAEVRLMITGQQAQMTAKSYTAPAMSGSNLAMKDEQFAYCRIQTAHVFTIYYFTAHQTKCIDVTSCAKPIRLDWYSLSTHKWVAGPYLLRQLSVRQWPHEISVICVHCSIRKAQILTRVCTNQRYYVQVGIEVDLSAPMADRP